MHEVDGNEYDKIANETELAKALTNDIRSVNGDKHLLVSPTVPSRRDFSADQTNHRLNLMQAHKFGFKSVEMLDSKVGYLEIEALIDTSFPGAGETAVNAMDHLSEAEYLIFDLRENRGGSPTMVQLLSTYLFEGDPIHLNSFYFRKNDRYQQFWTLPYVPGLRVPHAAVFILTSETTFSGAEEFAYNLQARNRATVVGAITRGGANPGDFLPLNKTLDLFVPHGRAINPITNTNWEGVGVQPDVICKPEDALQVALGLCERP